MKSIHYILLFIIVFFATPTEGEVMPKIDAERFMSPYQISRLEIEREVPVEEIASKLRALQTETLVDSLIISATTEATPGRAGALFRVADKVDPVIFQKRITAFLDHWVMVGNYMQAGHIIVYQTQEHPELHLMNAEQLVQVFKSPEFKKYSKMGNGGKYVWMFFSLASKIDGWEKTHQAKEVISDYLAWSKNFENDQFGVQEHIKAIVDKISGK